MPPQDGQRPTGVAPGVVRTQLTMRAREGSESAFEEAWAEAAQVISRVSGNLRQELMRSRSEPRDYTIVSDWADPGALEAFGRSSKRDQLTVSLRELREHAERATYEVVAVVPAQPPSIRVLVTTLVEPEEEQDFERGYLEVAAKVGQAPGHLREELLHEPGTKLYHLLAEWRSKGEFLAWVTDPRHTDKTGPLIPYLMRGFSRKIMEIVARPPEKDAPPTAATPPAAGTSVAVVLPPAAGTRTSPAALPRAEPPAEQVSTTDVLIVGSGPTGLTLAIELARRGVAARLVEKRPERSDSADKAIGVHCRTMEIWEDLGIVDEAIRRGIWLEGQIVVVNGRETHRVDWDVPELPYAHLGLPQYETEALLEDRLAALGGSVERGVALLGFDQDETGVTATLQRADGTSETVSAGWLVGCDGAHSTVRATLGLEFEAGGGHFPQLFMLGDAAVNWDVTPGHLVRFIAEDKGELRGMLICVPLPTPGRYRLATMAPPRVMAEAAKQGDVPPGTWQEFEPPTLAEFQAVLDRLGPPGATATDLRWASVFRINHGIAKKYSEGRVFVAGDAAHLHPPAGGQGMNTGIQDAYNLGWKLALAARGEAGPGLLDSYEAERRPAGAAVVDRAVQIAFTDEMDFADQRQQFLHEMQMLVSYRDTPLVGEVLDWDLGTGPGAGDRAPDVHGLTQHGVGRPRRLFELTAGTAHTLLLYVHEKADEPALRAIEDLGAQIQRERHGLVRVFLVMSPDAAVSPTGTIPTLVDSAGAFGEGWSPNGSGVYLIRPDGHIGFRGTPAFGVALLDHLSQVFTTA